MPAIVVIIGVFVVATTELLSVAHALTGPAIAAVWTLASIIAVVAARRRRLVAGLRIRLPHDPDARLWLAAMAVIALVTLYLALISPPAAWDSISYHVPRVTHWIQNRSVAHYPTHIDRQLWIAPGHEYFALHLELLTGSRFLLNVIQWSSLLGCAWIAAALAREIGAAARGQWFAALFTITMPMAVMQASSSSVDLFAAFWIALPVLLVVRLVKRAGAPILPRDGLLLGGAVGLAGFSKATAFLFLLPWIVWLLVVAARRWRSRMVVPAVLSLVVASAILLPHHIRNQHTYGSPLTNPRGETVVNETFAPWVLVSNIVRNVTLHTAARWPSVNRIQQRAVERLHRLAGWNASDPRTTFWNGRYRVFRPPRTEVFAGNPLHFVLALGAVFLTLRLKNNRTAALYTACVTGGLLLFCLVLKWQPWHSRLHLPLFVLSAAFTALVVDRWQKRNLTRVISVILLLGSLLPLLKNHLRPLIGPKPVYSKTPEERSFTDAYWYREPLVQVAEFLAANRCSRVGLMTSWGDFEEPLWTVMRNRSHGHVEIVHVAIPPDRYPPGPVTPPERVCAIVAMSAFRTRDYQIVRPPPGFELALTTARAKVFLPLTRQ